ncbi:3-deoxy-8-phosphooctulonate synthase, partial [Verrucomicrobiota bacterium]
MREFGYPVVFDATHSAQLPGGAGNRSGGESRLVPCLARAGVAAGCDAVFIETHSAPGKALSDKDSVLPFSQLRKLWKLLVKIDKLVRRGG